MTAAAGVYVSTVGQTKVADCSCCGARSVTHIEAPEMLRQFLSNHTHKDDA